MITQRGLHRALFIGAGLLVGSAAMAGTNPALAQDILIGAVGPLSQPGDVAAGTEMRWAMEQAITDVNAKGGALGRKFRLDFYDTENKTDVCAAVAKRLVEDDKVAAVVGEFHSGCALAQVPTYDKVGTPVVFSEPYNDMITGGDPNDPNLPANPPSIFRIAPSSTYYSNFVVDWIVNGIKAKNVAYVTDTTDYGTGAAKAVHDALAPTGTKLKQVSVELAQADYASILSRLKADMPDADVAYLDISETSTAYIVTQNAIDVGLVGPKTACVGMPGFRDDKSYWQALPNGTGCIFQFVGLTIPQYNNLAKSIDARATAQLGHRARSYSFTAYDAVLLVTDAIARAKSTDAKAVVAALEDTHAVGAQGRYSFPYNSKNPVPAGKPSWLWHQYVDPPLQLIEYTKKGQTVDQAAIVWPPSKQTYPGKAYVPVE